MTHTDLIANELRDSGFKTEVKSNGVKVSLNSRKVNNMEVREVLEQKFEGIRFNLTSTRNGILVTE